MLRADVISIVGGGWSVRDINLEKIPGTIIGVNDSAINLPRCDIAVSMDRLWTEYRWPRLREIRKEAHLRRSAMQNIHSRNWPWLAIFECNNESTEFTDERGILNGTSSGFCAFNLAYQMRPRQIFLFGFDMKHGPNGESYWYPPYPWSGPRGGTSSGKYFVWAKQFKSAAGKCKAAGIEVFNCSPHSAIDVFPKVAAREFAKETTS